MACRPSREQFTVTAALVRERLLTTHGFPLSQTDLEWIDRAFSAFYADGPEIQFWGVAHGATTRSDRRTRQLMTMRRYHGPAAQLPRDRGRIPVRQGSAGEEPDRSRRRGFRRVERDPSSRRLRRARMRDVVHAFYGSNVGVYLTTQQTRAFCRNLAALPVPPDGWFIESDGVRTLASKLATCQKDTGIGERTEHVPQSAL